MKIFYTDGPAVLETHGAGPIKRGEVRDMDNEYAYGLVSSGQVKLADDEESQKAYASIRKAKVEEAAKLGDTGGVIYCDQCQHEMNAKYFLEHGCPRAACPSNAVKEN